MIRKSRHYSLLFIFSLSACERRLVTKCAEAIKILCKISMVFLYAQKKAFSSVYYKENSLKGIYKSKMKLVNQYCFCALRITSNCHIPDLIPPIVMVTRILWKKKKKIKNIRFICVYSTIILIVYIYIILYFTQKTFILNFKIYMLKKYVKNYNFKLKILCNILYFKIIYIIFNVNKYILKISIYFL